MTGILLCAAGLPVCLTRAPKPILHPPPVSKSDVKPVPGVPGVCRKTKKKHLKKSRARAQTPAPPPTPACALAILSSLSRLRWLLPLSAGPASQTWNLTLPPVNHAPLGT